MLNTKKYYREVFSRLGCELEGFGTTYLTLSIAEDASHANSWFRVSDVVAAVESLRSGMLTDSILARWLSRCPEPGSRGKRVAVIMAGNIPLVGFHDLMCVLAAGHIPYIKPSSKDSVLMDYMTGLLASLSPETFIGRYDSRERYDAVIATGSDNTGRYFRSVFDGVPALIRGDRSSVALLRGDENAGEISLLGKDMFLYSGLGCRNVSLVLAPCEYDIIKLGDAVAPSLSELNLKYYNNYRSTRGKFSVEGVSFFDFGTFLVTFGDNFPVELSNIVVLRYGDMTQAMEWIGAHDHEIQCIVGRAIDHPRSVGFGRAQMPLPWDYPDGNDVMEFLAAL